MTQAEKQRLPDHRIAQLVNELTAIGREFGQTQQLRERVRQRVLRALTGSDLPLELEGVADAIAGGDGFWHSCFGCYETNEGYPPNGAYFSPTFMCHLGTGCSECGGIGAIWDTTDYDAMAEAMARGEGDADA